MPEEVCYDCNLEQIEQGEDSCEPSDTPPSVEPPSTGISTSDIHSPSDFLTPPTSSEIIDQASSAKLIQIGKLQQVLADLKISSLPIPESLRKRLICVDHSNLDAFAASPTDLGRTSWSCTLSRLVTRYRFVIS